MEIEDRSLEDLDSVASFKGATLQIQQDNLLTTTIATKPVDHMRVVDAQNPVDRGSETSPTSSRDFNSDTAKTDVAALPWTEDHVRNLFSSREGLVDQAVIDSIAVFVKPDLDGDVLGSWLLTEINIWDAEKERLVLLTSHSLLVVKFDFIALKPLDVRRTSLQQVDTVVLGDLVYPPASLVPRMNGLASGVSTIVKGCLLHWSRPTELCNTTLDVSQFEPRARNMSGLRIMWNHGEPITFSKKWNPFNNDIPLLTFASHPLLHYKESFQKEKGSPRSTASYDVETLSQHLVDVLSKMDKSKRSVVQHKPILLHNYLSVGSLIHNRNSLGFFKVRGRFSF